MVLTGRVRGNIPIPGFGRSSWRRGTGCWARSGARGTGGLGRDPVGRAGRVRHRPPTLRRSPAPISEAARPPSAAPGRDGRTRSPTRAARPGARRPHGRPARRSSALVALACRPPTTKPADRRRRCDADLTKPGGGRQGRPVRGGRLRTRRIAGSSPGNPRTRSANRIQLIIADCRQGPRLDPSRAGRMRRPRYPGRMPLLDDGSGESGMGASPRATRAVARGFPPGGRAGGAGGRGGGRPPRGWLDLAPPQPAISSADLRMTVGRSADR